MQPVIISIRMPLYASVTSLPRQPKDSTRMVVIGEEFGYDDTKVSVTGMAKRSGGGSISFSGSIVRIGNERMIVDLIPDEDKSKTDGGKQESKVDDDDSCKTRYSLDYLRLTVTNTDSDLSDDNTITNVELISTD